MSTEPPETEWYTLSFTFKIVGAELDVPAQLSRDLLKGMAQAVTYLMLPEEDYTGVKVYASDLRLEEGGSLFTDAMLDEALSQWSRRDDDPDPE